MQKKFFFVLIIAVFFVGYRSVQAIMMVPYFNINIVEQSVGGDGVFDFHYSTEFENGDFQIQTENGTGSYLTSVTGFSGTYVSLVETPIVGWKNTGVSCVSDEPLVKTYQIENGVTIKAYPYSSITCTFTNIKKADKPDPVIIIPGILGSAEKNGVWVIDPIFHTYDDLINTLVANGYEKDKDLFAFPYDWHKSNVVTEVQLRDKIAEVESICNCNKVDLVAHSMGGLVARYYIQSPLYMHDVDQLIFLGTPHLGAPKAYLPWEGAEMPSGIINQGIKTLLWWDAKKQGLSLFDYIHQSVISLAELLPVYDYLKIKNTNEVEQYPSGYPRNYFLENLNTNVSKLLDSGVKLTNIIGNIENSTIVSITVATSTKIGLWEDGYADALNYGEGDETVPINSSSYIDIDKYIIEADHTSLPSKAEGLVYEKLTGKSVQNDVHQQEINEALLIKIFSPADIQVIAPDGSIIGKNFSTGQEINQIPGAFYSGFQTEDEYITIPNPLPGNYTVKTVGTGSGSYTVATGLVSNDGSEEKEVIGTTKPGFVANVEVGVSDGGVLDVLPPDNQAITPDSVIADIELAYSNGWLNGKKTKEKLIKEIKAIVKVEKKIEKLETKVKGKNLEKRVIKLETKIDKVLAKALETELKLYNKGKILTDEGFNLIKNDIELLILIY